LCGAGYALIEHADDRCWSLAHRTLRCAAGATARRDAHSSRERHERHERHERADVDWRRMAAAWRSERVSATCASFELRRTIRSAPAIPAGQELIAALRKSSAGPARRPGAIVATKGGPFLQTLLKSRPCDILRCSA